MNNHILRTATWTDFDGNPQTQDVYEAQIGVRGGISEQKWERCRQCGYPFPEGDLTYINGVPYCIPHGCAEDQEESK